MARRPWPGSNSWAEEQQLGPGVARAKLLLGQAVAVAVAAGPSCCCYCFESKQLLLGGRPAAAVSPLLSLTRPQEAQIRAVIQYGCWVKYENGSN